MAVARAATATRPKATRVVNVEPASIDVMVGPTDGSRLCRVDVEVKPGLEVGISLPRELTPTVMALIRALGVTPGKGL